MYGISSSGFYFWETYHMRYGFPLNIYSKYKNGNFSSSTKTTMHHVFLGGLSEGWRGIEKYYLESTTMCMCLLNIRFVLILLFVILSYTRSYLPTNFGYMT